MPGLQFTTPTANATFTIAGDATWPSVIFRTAGQGESRELAAPVVWNALERTLHVRWLEAHPSAHASELTLRFDASGRLLR
jgi:hypothetical protein